MPSGAGPVLSDGVASKLLAALEASAEAEIERVKREQGMEARLVHRLEALESALQVSRRVKSLPVWAG